MDWMGMKDLAAELGVQKDALHIYAAVTIQIVVAGVLRKPLSSLIPWLAVLALEIVNEWLDVRYSGEPHLEQWQIDGARHDLVNTMILPTALLLLCRYVPALFVRVPAPAADAAADDGPADQD